MTQQQVSSSAASAEGVCPISTRRVEASLKNHGYAYVEDTDHPEVLRARFDDYRFQFMLTGEAGSVLQARGRWNRSVSAARKPEMLKLCNEWNMSRVWPKVYVRRESEGLLGLYGEVTSDFSSGGSDQQIDRAIECGLRTVIAFFRELEERLGSEVDELDA
ncbi:YbjN domain-containing protein [Brachybacterium endophyticum]|uniref:YbjN domain-containing protein n=1 Tax=Brachybacterium endophyticum TaxID=2182385 RepID=UPI001F0BA564|nr:YbjN domain-containing protein [Brachybacterium endophyticum]